MTTIIAASAAAALVGGWFLARTSVYPQAPDFRVHAAPWFVPVRYQPILTEAPTEWDTLKGRESWQTTPVAGEPTGVCLKEYNRRRLVERIPRGYASLIAPRSLSIHADNLWGLSV